MNRRHVFFALALSASLAVPAQAQPDAPLRSPVPASSAKSAAKPGPKGTSAATSLPGTWLSTQTAQNTLSGRIVLSTDGSAVLAADGQPELTGRWSTPAAGQLSLEMPPHGTAHMRFEQPRPDILVLVYENGTRQTFNKKAPSK